MGIGNGVFGWTCPSKYVLLVAGLCFLTTQVRVLKNTKIFTILSLVCCFAMAAIIVFAAFRYENPQKVEASWFGNPAPEYSAFRFMGAFTIPIWAYVPTFLTVELSAYMDSTDDFRNSLKLSAVLNLLVFFLVGLPTVYNWGYNCEEVITLTPGVKDTAWKAGSFTLASFYNFFQLMGNFVSYCLDSVPLTRFCQQKWAPNYGDRYTVCDILLYMMYTLPTFLFALVIVMFIPSVNTLLDFTTALSGPWVSHIFPAVLYWRFYSDQHQAYLLEQRGDNVTQGFNPVVPKWQVVYVFIVGCVSFVLCLSKAIAFLAIEDLRPMMVIGCDDWGWFSYSF